MSSVFSSGFKIPSFCKKSVANFASPVATGANALAMLPITGAMLEANDETALPMALQALPMALPTLLIALPILLQKPMIDVPFTVDLNWPCL